jgi:MFS superfamily sulfate permease-like transporter
MELAPDRLGRARYATAGTKAIVIDGETVPFIDVTAARMIEAVAEDLESDGIQLLLARDVGHVRRPEATRGGPPDRDPHVPDRTGRGHRCAGSTGGTGS